MATAPGEVPARDACVMASAAATRHVSAAEELAAAGVATPDVAAATPDVAAAMPATPEMAAPSEVTTAASGMAVRKRRAAAISRTPALELDAQRALVFKDTDIKTR